MPEIVGFLGYIRWIKRQFQPNTNSSHLKTDSIVTYYIRTLPIHFNTLHPNISICLFPQSLKRRICLTSSNDNHFLSSFDHNA